MPALFVTGTDTGVGKTVVTALLTRALRTAGADCVAMKPLASGCERTDGVLESEDALFLRSVGGFDAPSELVCPIRLEPPLAPLVAAQQNNLNTSDWPHRAREAFDELKRRHEWVLVEGVGGWCVPLWSRDDGSVATCADLVSSWNLPVVVVARRTLGTINHTTLTCRAVRESAELHGVIFCDAEPIESDDIAAHTSPKIACELSQARQLAFVPYESDWDKAARVLEPFVRELLR
ncbi:ATP-dependent dethiobiotin synthetase BioD 1 [Abditibacteriota bacterium]|nr:ATP-dependent dethiobiotin synthetase BioD 1 [Abditibacteriota bacterium]